MKKETKTPINLEVPISSEEAIFLNSVYRARYPGALGLLPDGEPTKKDAEFALEIANRIYKWAKNYFSISNQKA